MNCKKNGVGVDFGGGHVYVGDKYRCPICKDEIVSTNPKPCYDENHTLCAEYVKIEYADAVNSIFSLAQDKT